MAVLERFLRYVQIDTRSDDASSTCPSTPGQWTLLRLLTDELRDMGAADVTIDQHGYVMATIPATVDRPAPVVGFIAHVDTSPEMSGANVKPLVHTRWDGRDIVLPDHPSAVLRASEDAALEAQIGHDIVTASGATLLGADDKAGVAAIMTAAEYLLAYPEIPHGAIRLAFTPDEEIGRGATRFDVTQFAAGAAYTLDGGSCGELEFESFSADRMRVTFAGFNTHPGYAQGKMRNAIRAAARFVDRLPADLSPERTSGYDGFLHPYQLEASVDQTTVVLIVRDFVTAQLAVKQQLARTLAEDVARETGTAATIDIVEQYRNMREVLDDHPEVVERARAAIRRAGLSPIEKPIRGGTDGSRLSFMGLPTPNVFAGEHNFHSRLEWTSRQDLEKSVAVIIEIAREWAV
ncbi:MAG TPA: peptidase T [Vicinamibacterales bacterium]|jgi:tripeptide aminopeptidase